MAVIGWIRAGKVNDLLEAAVFLGFSREDQSCRVPAVSTAHLQPKNFSASACDGCITYRPPVSVLSLSLFSTPYYVIPCEGVNIIVPLVVICGIFLVKLTLSIVLPQCL